MRTRKGQALLIAVLLMTVILLVGAIFVATTVYVQSQSARHGQARQAKALADGALQYADRMLRTHTADWRPDDAPAWCSGDAAGNFDSVDAILDAAYAGDDEFDPGFWGPDGQPDTDDDYYAREELVRGWVGLRAGNALPADPNRPLYNDPAALDQAGETIRRGFTRLPDPRRSRPAGQDLPVSVSRGHALLRLTYDPDPPFENTADEDRNSDGAIDWQDADPLSHMILIEGVGSVIDEGFSFRRMLAYKPLALTDYVRFVTDQTGTGQPAYLGSPSWVDLDADGAEPAGSLAERTLTRFVGPVRVHSSLTLVGEEIGSGGNALPSLQFEVTTESGPDGAGVRNDPYLRRDVLTATSGIYYRDRASALATQASLTVNADPAAPAGPQPIWPTTSQQNWDQTFTTYGALTGVETPAITDGPKEPDQDGYSRFASALAAPRLSEREPVTGRPLYENLTRYSGDPVVAAGEAYPTNSGEWGHGTATFVDNFTDRQFVGSDGEGDLNALKDDWLRNLSPTDARAGDSGWNAVRTTYAPVGVEILIAGGEIQPTAHADPRTVPAGEYWAPQHVAGEPQIVLRRHDHTWRTPNGDDSGQMTMVIDHPTRRSANDPLTQVLCAAGNVRIKGVLPARSPRPTAIAPQDPASVFWADYNLTIVSGGAAYIDGSILSPRDADPAGVPAADDDRNTKLAILARDCVCLNTTQIVPQDATALVSAAPDDTDDPRPEASHWELTPEAGARLHSSWVFGAVPPAGARVYLAAVVSGDDPGPSALSMSLFQRWQAPPVWQPYLFNPVGGPPYLPAAYIFFFMPSGAATGVNVSNALTPRYQPVPDPSGQPAIPWDITDYLHPPAQPIRPGVWQDVAIAWANPAVSAGATNTWVKKWKVLETVPDAGGNPSPAPAVHCRVNAVMYAERGSWFVIPGAGFATVREIDASVGPQFADNINGRIDTADERARAIQYLRYNYDITVVGAITENAAAPVDAVQEWVDKWSYPGAGPGGTLPSITYVYDSSVRAARDYGLGGAGSAGATGILRSTQSANLPRLPLLPVSPDLVYYGETM